MVDRKIQGGAAIPVHIVGVGGAETPDEEGLLPVVSEGAAEDPTEYNLTLTNANTQYSQALPIGCQGFEFQCRTEADIRFAFVTGRVAAPTPPYLTLKAGDYYVSPAISQGDTPSTLYFASATAGVVVEIIAWT